MDTSESNANTSLFIPPSMRMTTKEMALDFIQKYNFAALITSELSASHLPFIYKQEDDGEYLYTHIANQNFQINHLKDQKVLVLFSGPHAFISTDCYVTSPSVPTWNYAVVHVEGIAQILNPQETSKAVALLLEKYEPNLFNAHTEQQKNYMEKLYAHITGIKIKITSINGKIKAGQHKNPEDQKGVFQNLSQSQNPYAIDLYHYMKDNNIGTGI